MLTNKIQRLRRGPYPEGVGTELCYLLSQNCPAERGAPFKVLQEMNEMGPDWVEGHHGQYTRRLKRGGIRLSKPEVWAMITVSIRRARRDS